MLFIENMIVENHLKKSTDNLFRTHKVNLTSATKSFSYSKKLKNKIK